MAIYRNETYTERVGEIVEVEITDGNNGVTDVEVIVGGESFIRAELTPAMMEALREHFAANPTTTK